jgi:hypothetical protein
MVVVWTACSAKFMLCGDVLLLGVSTWAVEEAVEGQALLVDVRR